jgi:mannose-1-phosphate guanylyltransferase
LDEERNSKVSNFYAVIMAGGSGTRLWPLSRQSRPKQAIELIDRRTMFQHAVDRLDGLLPFERILVVTAREYIDILASQVPELPRDNFVIEPMARGTAGAIGLSAVHLKRRDPQAVMAVLTADHYIPDVDKFCRALSAAAQVAMEGSIVTLGIKPNFPATGFGYIRRREQVGKADGFDIYAVDSFVEKPDLDRAVAFLETGLYSWNSGMFIWRVEQIMAEFARQMPDFYEQLQTIETVLGTAGEAETLVEVWPQVRRQTIDYGIMEGAEGVVVIPVDIGWIDIGDWAAISELHQPDDRGNVIIDADYVGLDTSSCFVRGRKRLIATVGVKDLIVIDTDDALLICARERAQDVKSIVEQLEEEGRAKYL